MGKQTNKNQIPFQINNIEILDSNLRFPGNLVNELETFHYNIQLQHRVDEVNKLLFVDTAVNILHKNKKTELGSIKVSCVYYIENLAEFKSTANKQFDFPNDFINAVNSISLSTTRGAMFSQMKGTFLHNAILPILDPKGFRHTP